jgi:hypothetical protein
MSNTTKRDKQRKLFEHETWKQSVNSSKDQVLFDAGELGFCLLTWSGSFSGHWTNSWFDKAETIKTKQPDLIAIGDALAETVERVTGESIGCGCGTDGPCKRCSKNDDDVDEAVRTWRNAVRRSSSTN